MNTPILTDLNKDENVYLLGLLWADGSLYKSTIELALTKKDFDCVSPIFEKFGYDKFEKRRVLKGGMTFGKEIMRIRITSKVIADFLLLVDFDKKSFISPTKILSQIPKEKQYLWWRGYIDGDGCFYCKGAIHNFSVWSTIRQDWSAFYNLCKKLDIENPILTKYKRMGGNHCSSKISLTKQEDIKKLGAFLYQRQLDIGLNRKREKYLLCISKPKPPFKKLKSNRKGVYYCQWTGKWIARKTTNRKRIRIGSYSNYEEACDSLMMSTV